MQLGYVMTTERGATDRLLSALAERLRANGIRTAGIVQTNTECADDRLCDMDVQVLPDGKVFRISQTLGRGARGCRLDPAALEEAVGLVTLSLNTDDRPDLLIVNKFGKHEADGRGMRPVIAEAMALGIPVITGVNGLNREKFETFSEGAAIQVTADLDALEKWVTAIPA
ncbi:MAG: DUF2478 domain-containing protein [Paracoccaceae bacterium]